MARPISTSKRDNEKKRESKRLEKLKRKEERKSNNSKGAALEDMLAYVDENGQITSTPPLPTDKRDDVELEDIVISTPKKDHSQEDEAYQGRVEFFNESKGYGFIKDMNSVRKYFFHISAAPKNIKEGSVVRFDLERGKRDLNAVNIKLEA